MSRYDDLLAEIAIYKPQTFLEIGTFRADHARLFIKRARVHHKNKYVYYYGFDIFDDLTNEMRSDEFFGKRKEPSYKYSKKRLTDLGANFTLIKGNTRDTLKSFQPSRKIDFVFVDGGHSVETIKSDCDNLLRFCEKGCVIYFDDYYEGKMDVGAKFLEEELRTKYDVSFLPTIDFEVINNLSVKIMKVVL